MGLAEILADGTGLTDQIEVRAFDGSRAGSPDAGVAIEIKSPRALAYVAQAGGDLGLARAYVMGDLEIHGDVHTALAHAGTLDLGTTLRRKIELFRKLGGLKLLKRVPVPPEEVRHLPGRRHSKKRDQAAISHHYDVSNKFYSWILGPSMAYTCAVYPSEEATLEQAQWAKHDLVAKKLGLRQGMRLLDIGCGWGGMVMHAAEHYGVKALGVTLSLRQAEWAQKAIAERGLTELAEVRHLDYRDVAETGFDAISSIGLTEHIGKAQLPGYFKFLYGKLKPGARLLNHCITRPNNLEPAVRENYFINRYIFPDGELEGPGYLLSLMTDTGFEVHHEENLREHYAMTLAAWSANLDEHWEEAVAEVGERKARIWKLYLAGSRWGFDRNNIQLHQILGVKLGPDHRSGMPLRPDW
ncbi:cyclopropane-fatty-acyl-phospholipid synthase [Rhizocola hellebori]|uniref:Cyclopropane-fatty-acyl-phospholipid synthase n=1 Tax=Rhizocola hellebori TaxID=1392758 RepID=A0A8J3Q7U3_9ACTN|nr:cyclopropane-fatty-acyl-phospholipid synthase family protein [Rhizocola hellebori]GIH05461.1 cyclopropane-fatty-acyl-phospholipid synthase [Rhizocola hellebori]